MQRAFAPYFAQAGRKQRRVPQSQAKGVAKLRSTGVRQLPSNGWSGGLPGSGGGFPFSLHKKGKPENQTTDWGQLVVESHKNTKAISKARLLIDKVAETRIHSRSAVKLMFV